MELYIVFIYNIVTTPPESKCFVILTCYHLSFHYGLVQLDDNFLPVRMVSFLAMALCFIGLL